MHANPKLADLMVADAADVAGRRSFADCCKSVEPSVLDEVRDSG
jgi:hypothetical protein